MLNSIKILQQRLIILCFSGIVFKQANKWYIRGVVSVSIALQNSLRCDPDHYAVFADVAKYTTWIDRNT